MKHKNFAKKSAGMIIPFVVCFMLLLSMFFLMIMNRVRRETVITNRVAIGERIYQAAVAVGRIGIRRLAKDFEAREPASEGLINALWNRSSGAEPKPVDYTSTIVNLDPVRGIKAAFKKEWGGKNEIEFKNISYQTIVDKNSFSAPITGLKTDPHECRGKLVFTVVATYLGISKKYTVEKEFLFTKLLAPPFYRFTLFSHNGADVGDDANACSANELGVLSDGKHPMVCLNELVGRNGTYRPTSDTRFLDHLLSGDFCSGAGSGNVSSFVKNGWVYLGGKKELKLNVVAGAEDKNSLNEDFGEFFHFYYSDDSLGWLSSAEWDSWLKEKVSPNVQIAFVDYGYFNMPPPGLLFLKYSDKFELFNPNKILNNQNYAKNGSNIFGSSMHLFGTPGFCTPTLVFGQVKRTYLRAFALFFGDLGRVLPLPAFNAPEWAGFWGLGANSIKSFYKRWNGTDLELIEKLKTNSKLAEYECYVNGVTEGGHNMCGVKPVAKCEPYTACLKNLCFPRTPNKDWKESVSNCSYLPKPDSLCASDYAFSNDAEINYSGKISELKLSSKYLRDRVAYKLKPDGSSGWKGKTLSLSKCGFFNEKYIVEDGDKEFKKLVLGQIIEIDGDLVIDVSLMVVRGGIILVNGDITIDKHILNQWVANSDEVDADSFGYLTLIGNNITIGTGAPTTRGFDDNPPIPQIHGFFMAMNKANGRITVGKRCHIVGGVAAGDIKELVKHGCVIEWGFVNGEFARPESERDFYGLAFGPRDIEMTSND